MKCLITGITGFSGPHLAKHLIQNHNEVYGIYRRENYKQIKDVLNHMIDDIIFLQCDLTDLQQLENIIKNNQFDVIYHMGAYTHPSSSFDNPEKVFLTNTISTITICEAIRKYSPKCILMHCSTCEVYGVLPENVRITEETILKPISPYAVSKTAAEQYVWERARNNFIKAVIVRPFSFTGQRRRANYCLSSDAIQIARIIKNKQEPIIKVGNLKAKRAVMDVRDVMKTVYTIVQKLQNNEIKNGEIFNISAEVPQEIGYYLNIMLKEYNLENVQLMIDQKLLRPIDIPTQQPDSSKLLQIYNFRDNNYPINETLRSLVDYWLEYEEYNI